MKKPILIVLAFAAAPLVLCFIGGCLAWAFSCTGVDYISKCAVQSMTGLVSGLVSMAWLVFVTVPLGAAALVVIAIVSLFRKPGSLE